MYSPQKVVRRFERGGLSKRRYPTTLGIHRTQDMVDRSVLASGVQRLQADQERVPPLRIEQLLKFAQPLLVALDLFLASL